MRNKLNFLAGILLLGAILLTAAGCAQWGGPVGETPLTAINSDFVASPSFSFNIQPIFNAYCISCHDGRPTSGNLNLTSAYTWSQLVDVTSSGYAPMLRVKPSDEANSVLYLKVLASSKGDRMPQGQAAIHAYDLFAIKNWILNGAPRN